MWGFKTNLNKIPGGSRQIIIIVFYNLRPNYFFFKWEGKAGRGDGPGQLKNSGRVGTWGVLTYIFSVFFSFKAVPSVDYIYFRAWRVRPRGGGDGSKLI